MTKYFNAAVDSNWANLANWWDDAGFTIQSTVLPTNADSVVTSAPVVIDFTAHDAALLAGHDYTAHDAALLQSISDALKANPATLTPAQQAVIDLAKRHIFWPS